LTRNPKNTFSNLPNDAHLPNQPSGARNEITSAVNMPAFTAGSSAASAVARSGVGAMTTMMPEISRPSRNGPAAAYVPSPASLYMYWTCAATTLLPSVVLPSLGASGPGFNATSW
jgi:hypothetical protein